MNNYELFKKLDIDKLSDFLQYTFDDQFGCQTCSPGFSGNCLESSCYWSDIGSSWLTFLQKEVDPDTVKILGIKEFIERGKVNE